ncbi:MAG: putative Ntn-hydrolase superfamily protein [Planctomycetota bacterium]|jgi:uncharacterized Ntn-hydrolase superfamily protein
MLVMALQKTKGSVMMKRPFLFVLLATVLCLSACQHAGSIPDTITEDPPVATFSIVGYDPATGDLGIAVQSKFFGVGSVVPWAQANVGAVATQSWANVTYGPEGLALMASGKTAKEALEQLTKLDGKRDQRQAGFVDANGTVASFTGKGCMDWAGHVEGKHHCAQGNILAGEKVVNGMSRAYLAAQLQPKSELADWLLAALQAGQKAGGDKRGRQSASMLVVRDKGGYSGGNDRYIDIRVEDHKTPITELSRLLELHKQFFRRAHMNRPKKVIDDPAKKK